jgi:hypothetical protein
MRISNEKKSIPIENIYTSDSNDRLPDGITAPEKRPYLILSVDANNSNFSFLQLYGQGNIVVRKNSGKPFFTLVVTGNRKITNVINNILTSSPEDSSSSLYKKIQAFKEKISPLKPKQSIPDQSCLIKDLRVSNSKLSTIGKNPVRKAKHRITGKTYIYKIDAAGRQVSEIEAFNAMCYRLLIADQTPEVFTVFDRDPATEHYNRVGLISEEIKGFQGFEQIPLEFLTINELSEGGLGSLAAAAYCERENDFNLGNIGRDHTGKLYKVDHGASSHPITGKYAAFEDRDTYRITNRDINDLPFVSKVKPYLFLFNGYKHDLHEIKNNPKFIYDKFYCLLKRILIDDEVYRQFAKLSIGNEKYQKMLADDKIQRTKELFDKLVKNVYFMQFFVNNQESLLSKIEEDFTRYNDSVSDKNQAVSIDSIIEKFNSFKTEHFTAEALEKLKEEHSCLPEKTLMKFKNEINASKNLTFADREAANKLYDVLSALEGTERNKIPFIAKQTCSLMEKNSITCKKISSAKSQDEKVGYIKIFTKECNVYEQNLLALSKSKKVFMFACTFIGGLLGATIGAVVGGAAGLTAGTAIGGGVGSVAPVFGNIAGAVVGGSIGGALGAIKLAGASAIIGTTIGAAAGTAVLAYLGYKTGQLSRHGIFSASQKAAQNFSKSLQKSTESLAELEQSRFSCFRR